MGNIDTSLTDIDFSSLDNYTNPKGFTDAKMSFSDGWATFEGNTTRGSILASKKLSKIKPATKYTLVFQVATKEIESSGDGIIYFNRTVDQTVFTEEKTFNLKDFDVPREKRILLESKTVIEDYNIGLHIQTLSNSRIKKIKFRWYLLEGDQVDVRPQPPEPQPPNPQDPTDGTGTSCPTSGIYGGYGQKLTDIKLFLYATNVTNGTIKLNKPQLEVGTVATDWRPNADEAIKHYTPAYKQVRGLAIQQGSNDKKYLEIPTVEGTIYGGDLWGGDTAKLLKDEIAELKEQIKELKNQIK